MSSGFQPHLYAITALGLEPVAAQELRDLGATGVEEKAGGVQFADEKAMIMRANLWLRSASRVLKVVAGGRVRSWDRFEKIAASAPWDDLLPSRTSIRLRVACTRSKLYHERAVSERLSGMLGRPAGGPGDPEIWVRIHEDRCTLSLDSSGELLHRRGYRIFGGAAPLRETLAAGVLLASGWDPKTPLLDPMCGSGTFAVEAAWIAQRRAPGLSRRFAFESWRSMVGARWDEEKHEAWQHLYPAESVPEIVGVDRDASAIEIATSNAERAEAVVRFEQAHIRQVGADDPPGMVVANPPYGRRLDRGRRAFGLVEQLMERLPGWRATVLYALPGRLPRGWTETLRLRNGGIRIRVISR